MNKTYRIEKISDLLMVPIERREDCVRNMLYVLALHELTFGVDAATKELKSFAWTDDGNNNVTLRGPDWVDVVSLEVKA